MYKYARNNKGIVELYARLPEGFNGFGFENSSIETQQKNGFYTINYQQLEEYQNYTYKLIPSDFNLKLKQWVMPVTTKTDEEITEIKQTSKKEKRNQLLANGIIVQNIWFNEEKLSQFNGMALSISFMGGTSMEWGKEGDNGTTVFEPIGVPEEAFGIVQEASAAFQQIYKDYL